MDCREIFPQRLRKRMAEKCLTNSQLADKTGLSFVSIRNYERGKTLPQAEILVTLADELKISIDYLLGRSDEK